MTVFDNLAFPLKNRGKNAGFIKKRVHEIAEALDLTPFLNKRASGLAADAKQKISLGRGLVRDDVAAILFDEPLTVIDPHLKWQLRRKLKEIHKQFGLTLIYVTHDQTEAMTFAEKIVIMYEGRLVQIGTPEELFENPAHTFVGYFIGSPGMNFVDCTVDGGRVVFSGGSLSLPQSLPKRAQTMKGAFRLGIRPLYLELMDAPCENGMQAHVVSMEDEGSSRIVTLKVGNAILKSRRIEGAHVPDVGTTCWVCFPPEKTRLFCNDHLVSGEVGQ
jgi:glycerol transport system ATP-binding protein